jgi:hypothetical protein
MKMLGHLDLFPCLDGRNGFFPNVFFPTTHIVKGNFNSAGVHSVHRQCAPESRIQSSPRENERQQDVHRVEGGSTLTMASMKMVL